MPIKLVVADDHQMFRETLRHLFLNRAENLVVMAEAEDGAATLSAISRYKPDVLLLDCQMPEACRFSTFCKEIISRSPATRILVLTGYTDEQFALEAAVGGARGYVVKGDSIKDLLDAIVTVNEGGIWVCPKLSREVFATFLRHEVNRENKNLEKLSRQELRILAFVSKAMSNREIAKRIHISQKTVKNHLTRIFRKIGVASRQQATAYFLGRTKSAPAVSP
jgi:two-component system response regulator DegU